MAKEVNWIPDETIREVCRKVENEEIDFGPSEAVKAEIEKKGITLKIIKQKHMEEIKKSKRGGARPGCGRKVTPYKIPLNVRISQEAADMISGIPAKSEYIDDLIKKANK